jgi:hypothetical protein
MTAGARLAEISWRYQRRKPGGKMSLAVLRIKEIGYLINHRFRHHGYVLPRSSVGRDIAFAMACHIARRPDAEHRLERWLGLWCPWMTRDEAGSFVSRTIAKPHRLTADKLGALLRLTEEERQGLGITTIGSIEVSKEERARRRREAGRQRDERRRRSKGAKPREDYEAKSKSRTKPWAKFGMSRASWYRAGKPMPDAELHDAKSTTENRETSPRAAFLTCQQRAHPSQG